MKRRNFLILYFCNTSKDAQGFVIHKNLQDCKRTVTQHCMSSKGFGQVGHKNKRGFQVPNTFFQSVKQPLMNNYISCVEALYFS